MTDDDAAPQTPLPPPHGVDAGEALLHERCGRIGEELVEVFGHEAFIPALSVAGLLWLRPGVRR